MIVNSREWSFEGNGGRVAVSLRRPGRPPRRGATAERLTGDVAADLHGCG